MTGHIYLFIYLFIIYKLRQEAWITHKASSTTRSRKKEMTISNTTNMNDNTLETTKKRNGNAKTELGRTSIKNQQHIRSSKLFNGRLVWHLIRPLVSTSLINRLSEIQVVIKMISVPEVGR